MLKLAFKSQLAYTRNRGFQTAANALPFEVLAGFSGVKSEMVEPTENFTNHFELRKILEEWEIILWWQQVEREKENCKSVQEWQDFDI